MTDRPRNRGKGENINVRVMVLVHDVLSECALQMYEISLKYLTIEWTLNSIANDQREITPKISKAEFWFLGMTRRLNVLTIQVYEVSLKYLQRFSIYRADMIL